MAHQIFPTVNFVFSHDGHFGVWGGVELHLRWCTAIFILPCPPPPTPKQFRCPERVCVGGGVGGAIPTKLEYASARAGRG